MRPLLKLGTIILTSSMLVACSSSDDDSNEDGANDTPTEQAPPVDAAAQAQFEVTITNLTNAQPLSPAAIIFHQNEFNSFIDGETASPALELLAEGGDNADVLAEAQAASQHIASESTDGPVPPRTISSPVTLSVPTDNLSDLRLSVITMLVHTNDGFTGTNATDISNMNVGDSQVLTGPTWDAGTEINDELGSNLPGPDFGGEGFNAARDDLVDRVRIHQSVVTSESAEFGLPTSSLQDRHRFLNPTSRITITRTE